MIELERHIEILLLSNDCVIVPGLGGFMTHHIDASYNEAEHLFLPPLRTLGFNSQLTINDSLLAQSYVEAYDISFPEAVKRIEAEVGELKRDLSTEGSYQLNDIGILSINENGNYEFKPCEAGILSPSLYGLNSFSIEKLKDAKTDNVPLREPDLKEPHTIQKEQPQLPNISETNCSSEEKKKNENDAIVIHMHSLRNAVAVAAAIICFFMFTLPLSNTTSNNINESSIRNGVIYKLINNDVKVPKHTNKDRRQLVKIYKQDTSAKDAKDESQTDSVSYKASTVNCKPYCLVLASRVTIRNAKSFVEKLQSEGYDDARLFIKGKSIKVVFGNYESESKAYKELNRLHNRDYFAEAWVYKI